MTEATVWAYDDGANAFLAGESFSSNPYSATSQKPELSAWWQGWWHEEEVRKVESRAWNRGWQACLDDNSENPYPYDESDEADCRAQWAEGFAAAKQLYGKETE